LSDRHSRLGESGSPKRDRKDGAHVERDFSFRRGVYCVERVWSRPGETTSPKRDIEVMCDVFG